MVITIQNDDSDSIDDLLRIQEQRAAKRRRISAESDQSDSKSSDFEKISETQSASVHSGANSDDDLEITVDSPLQTESQLPSRLSKAPESSINHTNERATSFSTLGVSQPLQMALNAMSIKTPTEIQAACIPPLLTGRDCIGNAKTGSGKTVAFAIPILQALSLDPYGIFAVVLTPTRELAFQISDQFAVLGASINIRTSVIVGGMDMIFQALELGNRPHVVVATPGRLVDLFRSNNGEWDLSRVKVLILDEADRLLTPTFAPELSYLFSVLPKDRQTGLFTATLTPSIDSIANSKPRPGKQRPFMHRTSQRIETVDTLQQQYLLVPSHVREPYLVYFLRNPPQFIAHLRRQPPSEIGKNGRPSKKKTKIEASEDQAQPPPTIIFCRKPRTVAYLTILLKSLSIRSTALHSRLTQRERLSSLSLFRASVVPVLISTDVGARGLDVDDVAVVINWDLPDEPEEYTHRVGRTARAGKTGLAVSFLTEHDEDRVLNIEARIGTRLQELTLPEAKVLEGFNEVSTAKRLANMELHDTDFGRRERTHREKSSKRESKG